MTAIRFIQTNLVRYPAADLVLAGIAAVDKLVARKNKTVS
jgi:hypothetical protein